MSPNQRQENAINGMQVLTNFDLHAAGAGNKANIHRSPSRPTAADKSPSSSSRCSKRVEGIEVIPTSDTVAAFRAAMTNGL